MLNKYKYIDPEYIYTDPETGVLRNLAGVTDHYTLTIVETGATSKRAVLNLNPPDSADIYERYMSGTVNSDVEILTKLIAELIGEIQK
jgi:hypothetical protein